MKVSEIFGLDKTQFELDFVDIDIEKDTPLFIDPYIISKSDFELAHKLNNTITNFFEYLLLNLKNGENDYAFSLFSHLGEPNEFCLGLSKYKPRGTGIGSWNTKEIFRSIKNSRAFKSGLIEDIQDFRLFVDGIDKDKTSDMTANIIKLHLIEYTKNQCKFWGIPLTSGVLSGWYWDEKTESWKNEYTDMLLIGDKKIILVPKRIVCFSKSYSTNQYLQHFILNFLQYENIQAHTELVKKRKDKREYVTKKSIIAKEKRDVVIDKEWITKFTEKHSDLLKNFKNEVYKKEDFFDADENQKAKLKNICENLILRLKEIKHGQDEASIYHKHILGILELIFYPTLSNSRIEEKIHDGRKRIDITFDNCAESGFFFRISATHRIPSRLILIECKNYKHDVTNPELDQLSGRFSVNRGEFGFLICRKIENMSLFLKRCSDTYNDGRGLIIPLTDNDIIDFLNCIIADKYSDIDEFLQQRFHNVINS